MRKWLTAAVAAAVAAGGAVLAYSWDSGQDYTLVMPSAANLVDGSPVRARGEQVGSVTSMEASDGKALVRVSLSDASAMHAGATPRVSWDALVGERVVDIVPGPASAPQLPAGSIVNAQGSQVEVDEVLSALDAPTREHLQSLLKRVGPTLHGSESDLNATLRTAGPTVEALGKVLQGVGSDGPAIRSVITQLQKMTQPIADRRAELSGTVQNLTQATAALADQQDQLGAGLRQLPPTLGSARRTLDDVQPAAQQAKPLLEDLRPASQQLPSVAANLGPTLADLRPAVADLKPVLAGAQRLLGNTPGLLDSAHRTVPPATTLVRDLTPALSFVRPYTPDLTGWLTNWSGAFSNYDSRGHFFQGLLQAATSAADEMPAGINPPGVSKDDRPAPGSAEGQPWTDATGSGIG